MMRKKLRRIQRFFLRRSVLISFVFLAIHVNASADEGKNELTLRPSTVKGDVIEAMEIDLINLQKNRREKIKQELNNQVVVKKHFLLERSPGQRDRRAFGAPLSPGKPASIP